MAAEPVPDSHLSEDHLERIPDSEQGLIDEQAVQLPDPYLNPLEEIVLDTGVIPCSVHGYDYLSRDPTCEFCKKAIGPLYLAKMNALRHTEVPSTSSSSSSSSTSLSRTTKAQGKQQSQPHRDVAPPVLETSADMATDQSIEQEDMSLPIEETVQSQAATSWADIAAQDEDAEQRIINIENEGIRAGDQEKAWSRVTDMTDPVSS